MLGAPAGALERDDEDATGFDEAIILTHIEVLNYDVIDLFRSTGAKVSKENNLSLGERFWMNHSEHCDTKIGDRYQQKSGFAFFPATDDEMARVAVREYSTALQARSGVLVGVAQRIVDFRASTLGT